MAELVTSFTQDWMLGHLQAEDNATQCHFHLASDALGGGQGCQSDS